MAAAIRSHFEFWNIIDLLVAMLSMASLVLMGVATHSDAAVDIDLLRCFQATAGLLGGIKLLSFLRGLDFSAFLISMLEAIVAACYIYLPITFSTVVPPRPIKNRILFAPWEFMELASLLVSRQLLPPSAFAS